MPSRHWEVPVAAFDPFRFLEERRNCLPVSDMDKVEFQLYNVVQAVSMDPRMRKVTHELNELSFSHLPRDIQAMTMTGLNGVRMDTRWCRAKTSSLQERDSQIDHAMRVLNMPHHDVLEAQRYGLIKTDEVEDAYMRLYEPDKLLAKYSSKKTGRKRK